MSARQVIISAAEAETLDEAEVIEGYRDGRSGDPEPGDNRSLSYWHGWRNGRVDGHHAEIDPAQRALAHDYAIRRVPTPKPGDSK